MKKTFFILFTVAILIACAYENKAKINTSFSKKTDYLERFNFFKKALYKNTLSELKKGVFSSELKKYSESTLKQITNHLLTKGTKSITSENLNDTIYTISKTYKEQIEYVDLLYANKQVNYEVELINLFFPSWSYIKEISNIDNDFITLYWSPGQNLASDCYQILWINNGKVIDLGNGYDYLNKNEMVYLQKNIKEKIATYTYISSRCETHININKEGTYTLTFYALDLDDMETVPTLRISYDTKDFKTIIPDSIIVDKDDLYNSRV